MAGIKWVRGGGQRSVLRTRRNTAWPPSPWSLQQVGRHSSRIQPWGLVTLIFSAYLVILWGSSNDVVHQCGHQLSHLVHTGGGRSIPSGWADGLAFCLGHIHPLPCYRVYDVENSQLVCCRGLLEPGVELLDENRFGLRGASCQWDASCTAAMAETETETAGPSRAGNAPYLNIADTELIEGRDARP